MRRTAALSSLAAILLATTACSPTSTPEPSTVTVTAPASTALSTPTAPPASAAPTSANPQSSALASSIPAQPSVNLSPQRGEAFTVPDAQGTAAATARLRTIKVLPRCEGSQAQQGQGRWVALKFSVEALSDGAHLLTGWGAADSASQPLAVAVQGSPTAGSCQAMQPRLPATLSAGQHRTGWVLLEVPSDATIITWAPAGANGASYSWNDWSSWGS